MPLSAWEHLSYAIAGVASPDQTTQAYPAPIPEVRFDQSSLHEASPNLNPKPRCEIWQLFTIDPLDGAYFQSFF
jgi:hypothetical protein